MQVGWFVMLRLENLWTEYVIHCMPERHFYNLRPVLYIKCLWSFRHLWRDAQVISYLRCWSLLCQCTLLHKFGHCMGSYLSVVPVGQLQRQLEVTPYSSGIRYYTHPGVGVLARKNRLPLNLHLQWNILLV